MKNDNFRLPSKEEYIKDNSPRIKVEPVWSEPLYACPQCGGEMRMKIHVLATSYPPKYFYKCASCPFGETF